MPVSVHGRRAANLYENLMLSPGATDDEIAAHVRHARKVCHPEWLMRTQPANAHAADALRQIIDGTADILLDREKRRIYDFLLSKTKLLPSVHGGRSTPFSLITDLIQTAAEYKARSRKGDKRRGKRK